MNRFGILICGLFVSTSSLFGCVSADPSEDSEDAPVAEDTGALTQLALPNGGIKLLNGRCNDDGFILESGRVYRLGQDIGPDVTGLSMRNRVSMDQAVCHNVKAWTPLVTYACNVNTAAGNDVDATVGTFYGAVTGPTEWINFVQMQYPNERMADGLYLGYAMFPGRGDDSVFPEGDPCPISAKADIPLGRIECCATAPVQ